MNRLKVALIYLGRRGGGALYSLEVAKALTEKADILAVISRQASNLAKWQESGLPLLEVNTYNRARKVVPSSLNIKKHLSLRRGIRRFEPDVLYYPMLHLWTPLINCLLPSVPKVTTIHDPILHQGERNPVLALLQRITIRQSARTIILSRIFLDAMERQSMPHERIDIIPHGEFSYYASTTVEPSLRKNPCSPTLLFFGRISKYKGLEVLLESFPLIKKQVPQARLLIVGNGDLKPYEAQLAALKDVTVINQWVKDEEVASYFRQANVLVVPYTDASQSGVIPIAYTLKVPVVATRIGGIPEQVEDGKTGLLVPPGNVPQLSEACVRLLTDSLSATKLGHAGYEKAMREWSWEHIADQVIVSLKKACSVQHRKKQ